MIEIRGVRKSFGSLRVIENANLAVDNGGSIAIVGPSGSGKSTLLKILSLIIPPDEGRIIVDSEVVADSNRESLARTRVSYSFQEPLLLPYLTVIENLTFIPRYPGHDGLGFESSAEDLLRRVGLGDRMKYYPPSLSVGERKRIDIVRALARKTSILIADEPLSNLDKASGELVMEMLNEHTRGGGSLIYSCLDDSEARFATSRYVMKSQAAMSQAPKT